MSMMGNNMIVWSPGCTLEAVEEQIIKRALTFYKGNKTMTAQSLGIAIRTLDNKLEKYFEVEKKNEENSKDEKKRREEFIARCRGKVPPVELEKSENDGQIVESEVSEREQSSVEVNDDSIQVTNLRSKRRG